MCKHKTARFLDCEDCKIKGIPCEEFICCDCGESVKREDYDCSHIGIYVRS